MTHEEARLPSVSLLAIVLLSEPVRGIALYIARCFGKLHLIIINKHSFAHIMFQASRVAARKSVSPILTRSASTTPNDRGSNTFVLPHGRTLGYSDYGNPEGTPLFFFPGTPDVRLSIRTTDNLAKRLNIRFIGIDRPGLGLSTFYPNRKITDWPTDFQHLVNHLKIDQYRIMSISGGTPYALACAKVLPREKLRAVGVVVGVGPWEAGRQGQSWGNRLGMNMWAYGPTRKMMKAMLTWSWVSMAQDPDRTKFESAAKKLLKSAKESDQKAFESPEEFDLLVDAFREAYKQGAEGVAEEYRLVTSPWGFDMEDVKYDKIKLWYGSEDVNTPLQMGQYMAKKLPHAELTILPGKSHFTAWGHIEEILTNLLKENEEGQKK